MGDKGRNHPDDDFPTLVGGSAAVSSGSSDAGSSPPPDSPTIVDLGSDAPTMHEGTPPPGAVRPPQAEDENFFKNGTVLAGRYEILSVLGEGGMGAVYKAKDRELNRTVALKVIRPELARNSAIVERFKHELRLSHQVTHKNVIRIYDLGESHGVKFITMEFIDGQDLRSLIREKQKFSPEEAVETMRQVCQALDAAHSVGVIHRDLKPQNIIRDTNGRVLVMDFGLARTIGGDGMTQSGALVGTMEYMSPEQALGQELDLGCPSSHSSAGHLLQLGGRVHAIEMLNFTCIVRQVQTGTDSHLENRSYRLRNPSLAQAGRFLVPHREIDESGQNVFRVCSHRDSAASLFSIWRA